MNTDFWNDRFSDPEEYYYGTDANAFFKRIIDSLAPGKLLLPGEGEGRNAVYAAEAGWEVDAFDSSKNAQIKALKLADKRNVTINYEVGTVDSYSCKSDTYDVIMLLFLHLPPNERRTFHKKLIKCLKNGGSLHLIAFSKEQINYNSGGPKDSSLLYSKEELYHDFEELSIDLIQEEEIELHEGKGHEGKAHVIKITAIRGRGEEEEKDKISF